MILSAKPPTCLLLGSGEYLDWAGEAELDALKGATGDGSVVLLATASAPEGEDVFSNWNSLGERHFAQLGVTARVLPVRSREDAHSEQNVAAVGDCSMVFFSGGNPTYLAETMEGTPLWARVLEALQRGAVYGGCSAGAMVVGSPPSGGYGRFTFGSGLTLRPDEVYGVHWDSKFMRALRLAMARRVPKDKRFLGIAEQTAILSAPGGWRVYGRGAIDVRDGSGRHLYRSGELIPAQ